jgi:hypothetical protein
MPVEFGIPPGEKVIPRASPSKRHQCGNKVLVPKQPASDETSRRKSALARVLVIRIMLGFSFSYWVQTYLGLVTGKRASGVQAKGSEQLT